MHTIVHEKYNLLATLNIGELPIPPSGGPWRNICASLMSHPAAYNLLVNDIWKIDGDGSSSLFCHDVWLGSIPQNQIPKTFLNHLFSSRLRRLLRLLGWL